MGRCSDRIHVRTYLGVVIQKVHLDPLPLVVVVLSPLLLSRPINRRSRKEGLEEVMRPHRIGSLGRTVSQGEVYWEEKGEDQRRGRRTETSDPDHLRGNKNRALMRGYGILKRRVRRGCGTFIQ